MSPTHFVSNISHQHRCNRATSLAKKMFRLIRRTPRWTTPGDNRKFTVFACEIRQILNILELWENFRESVLFEEMQIESILYVAFRIKFSIIFEPVFEPFSSRLFEQFCSCLFTSLFNLINHEHFSLFTNIHSIVIFLSHFRYRNPKKMQIFVKFETIEWEYDPPRDKCLLRVDFHSLLN